MIRNFLNNIKSYLVTGKDGEGKVEVFAFHGDGRGTTECHENGLENISLEVLEKYKYDCAAQFALATKCIKLKQEMLGDTEEEVEYKNGEVFRILVQKRAFGIGDKFIVTGDQKIKKGEDIIGSVPSHGVFSCKLRSTDIVKQDAAFVKSSPHILDAKGATVDLTSLDNTSIPADPALPIDLTDKSIN
jgi:hypothetical protein